jgi:putative ABC transport system permease protein
MFFTTLSLALRSIRRHLLRSFLTILGIVIGVGAVVTMVTLGEATTAAVQKSISALGTNILQVRPGHGRSPGRLPLAATGPRQRKARATRSASSATRSRRTSSRAAIPSAGVSA